MAREHATPASTQAKLTSVRPRKPQDGAETSVLLQRLESAPGSIRPADVLQLQRAIGNRATGRLLQAKLKLGPAGDVYEQEADRVAQQVVHASRQPDAQREGVDEEELQAKPLTDRISQLRRAYLASAGVQRAGMEEEELQAKRTFVASPQMPKVQRADLNGEELQAKPATDRISQVRRAYLTTAGVQRAGMEEDELQAAPNHGLEGGDVDTDVARSIQSAKGGGAPLHDGVRSSMEQGFGADFSGVRVHTGGQADALNRSLNARAFTTGNDIFFGKGQYNPGSSGGQELIAHELTHTVQQGAANPPRAQRKALQIQRFSDEDAKPGGHPNWNDETVRVTKSAAGQASGVFFPEDQQGEKIVVKPEYADNDVRPTTAAQMQLADLVLSQFGFTLPDSRIVRSGEGEFNEIVSVIGSDNPRRLDFGPKEGDPEGMFQQVRARLMAAKFLKIMTAAKGRSWEQAVESVQSQETADEFLAMLSANEFAFVRNMGKMVVADALIGNDDRASFNTSFKKFGMNMGNLMIGGDNSFILIDSDAGIGDLQEGIGKKKGGAFKTGKGDTVDLLNPLFDQPEVFAETLFTKHIRNAFHDQVSGKTLPQGFDLLAYFDQWTTQHLPTAIAAFRTGISDGLQQVSDLFGDKQRMGGLKNEAETHGEGEEQSLWATFKTRGKYLQSRSEGLGLNEALAQSGAYQEYKFGMQITPEVAPLNEGLLDINIPKNPKGLEKVSWKMGKRKGEHSQALAMKNQVRQSLESGRMSNRLRILEEDGSLTPSKLREALRNVQTILEEVQKDTKGTRSSRKLQFMADCYSLGIEIQKKHAEIHDHLLQLTGLIAVVNGGKEGKQIDLARERLNRLIDAPINAEMLQQAPQLGASAGRVQAALRKSSPNLANVLRDVTTGLQTISNELTGVYSSYKNSRKTRRRQIGRGRIGLDFNLDI